VRTALLPGLPTGDWQQEVARSCVSLETILLVDRDTDLRRVVRTVLQHLGYQVLEAGSEADAVNTVLAPDFTIDLLLTDIGPESADHLKELRPDMKVICISSDQKRLVDWHVLKQRYPVIQRPIKPHTLARKIREVLDQPEDDGTPEFTRGLQHRRLGDLDSSHPYFMRRGITTETAKHFGAGFFPGPGEMTGRILIPFYSEEGDLIAYAGQSVNDPNPNYKFWPEFNKSQVLFNLKPPRCLITEFDFSVVVVDELFDCMKVHQAGFPSVVSLTGPSLSAVQEQLLTENFCLIILLFNQSEAARRVATRLMKNSFVRILADAVGRPPHSLSSDDIANLMCGITESDHSVMPFPAGRSVPG
jgi:CheY-like chemotaxis protein